MKDSKSAKLLFTVLSVSLILCAVFALASQASTPASAEPEKPVIVSQNISSEGLVHLVYAISITDNVRADNTSINVYDTDPRTAPDAKPLATYRGGEEPALIDGSTANYIIIKTGGISAKNIGKYYYAQAVTDSDTKGDVLRYSVAEYLYERTYVHESSAEQLAFYDAMLDYAYAADKLYNKPADGNSLADKKYVYVDKDTSTLDENGNYSGLYKEGDTLELNYGGAGNRDAWILRSADTKTAQTESSFTVSAYCTVITPKLIETFKNVNYGLKTSQSDALGKAYLPGNMIWCDLANSDISDHAFGIANDPTDETNKVLRFQKSTTDNTHKDGYLYIEPEKSDNYNAVIFEADIYAEKLNWKKGVNGGGEYRLDFKFNSAKGGSTTHQFRLFTRMDTNMGYRLCDGSDYTEKTTTLLPYGANWFNLRIEYYITGENTTRTIVYFNNVKIEDVEYRNNNTSTKIETLSIEPYNASQPNLVNLYMDNVSFMQVNKDVPSAESKNELTFDKDESVNIIVPDGKESMGLKATELAKDYTGVPAIISNASSENAASLPNKLVIGNTGLDISNIAYEELAKHSESDSYTYTAGVLYYSDGNSIAIAYNIRDDITKYEECIVISAIAHLKEIYPPIGNGLNIPAGTVRYEEISLRAGMEAVDKAEKSNAWAKVEAAVKANNPENVEVIMKAFKDMYAIYDGEKLATWLAGIYDIETGGFYFSNSARDYTQAPYYMTEEDYKNGNVKYADLLPDIESTDQALDFINKSGMIYGTTGLSGNALPDWMRNSLIAFVKDKQDTDGYFYHPQWEGLEIGTRNVGRDLSKALSALSMLGAKPTYDTPTGEKGDGLLADGTLVVSTAALTLPMRTSTVAAVSSVIMVNTVVSDPTANRFNSVDDFKTYLDYLYNTKFNNNGSHDFYAIGDEIASQADQIKNKGDAFGNALAEWFETYQNSNTGFWSDRTDDKVTQEDLNAFMKISSAYQTIGLEIPNAAKAAKSALATITMQHDWPTACFVFNSWVSVVNIIRNVTQFAGDTAETIVNEIRADLFANAETYITATINKQKNFSVADGSFSYSDDTVESDGDHHTSGYIIGIPSYYPIEDTPEGSMNSVYLCTIGTLEQIFAAYGIDRVPMLGRADLYTFITAVEENYTEYNQSNN